MILPESECYPLITDDDDRIELFSRDKITACLQEADRILRELAEQVSEICGGGASLTIPSTPKPVGHDSGCYVTYSRRQLNDYSTNFDRTCRSLISILVQKAHSIDLLMCWRNVFEDPPPFLADCKDIADLLGDRMVVLNRTSGTQTSKQWLDRYLGQKEGRNG
jgi:hypothetical protein